MVLPQRLAFCAMKCMFCDGTACLTQYIYLPDRMGFMSCVSCQDRMAQAVKCYHETQAYGPANYLSGQKITIMRSNGTRESNWILDNPFTSLTPNGEEMIHCYHAQNNLGRWCRLSEILELNPRPLN
jgi:hypothetical protein